MSPENSEIYLEIYASSLHSNSSITATENEMNDSKSTHDYEHNVDMQKVKDVLK